MEKKGIVTIVVLSILVLVLSGFIVYDKVYLKIKEKEKKEMSNIQKVDVDVNELFNIDTMLETLDKATNFENSNYFGQLYKQNTLKTKNMNNELALYLVMFDELNGTGNYNYLNGNKIKKKFQNYYGDYLEYKPTQIDLGNNIKISYSETNNLFVYGLINKNNLNGKAFFTKNISTSLKDYTVTVKRKIFYAEYNKLPSGDTINSVNVYKDSSKKDLIATEELIDGFISVDQIVEKYGTKIDTFIYTFKMDNDTKYNLYSIEKEK